MSVDAETSGNGHKAAAEGALSFSGYQKFVIALLAFLQFSADMPRYPAACHIGTPYGHHHPDYMRGAAAAITTKQSQNVSGQSANVSLVVSLVEPENGRANRRKT
jgi:hypothetical protein